MLKTTVKTVLNQLEFSTALLWRKFNTPPLPDLEQIWVHIGCGDINDPRFINVEARPLKHVHLLTETPSLIEFKDNFADLIYASHVLEHFSHKIVSEVLGNWYRVLKPGGILRLSVPDFDKLVDVYFAKDRNVDSIIGMLMGGQSYETNYHYTIFNKENLVSILEKVGFQDVREWSPKNMDNWPRDFSRAEGVSLNIEAVK